MKKLVIFLFLLITGIINCETKENEQKIEKKTEKIEFINNSNTINMEIDIDELFELDNLSKPELQEPSRLIIYLRKYGLAFMYLLHDFKAWLTNKSNKIINKCMKVKK